MAKTRSQTRGLGIKKEEEDCKPTLLLNGVNSTTRNKITKRKPSKNRSKNLVVPEIKVEEDTDIKSLLRSPPKSSKLSTGRRVSQEQINQLIDYIANDKLSVHKAAPKTNMSVKRAYHYYNEYKNDPEKKIPSPRSRIMQPRRCYSQEQIQNLIRYIDGDKMSVKQASSKANINYHSGKQYYKRYLKDPDHNIPIPRLCQNYTQDQKNEFIGYIVNDKMSIKAASRKAIIRVDTGYFFYHKYFKIQNPDIPTPSHINPRQPLTQEQISKVISYIIDDKMTITAAAEKVNISRQSAGKHYRQYLKDNNIERPVSTSKYRNRYTQETKDQLIRLILDEKMTIRAAGRKVDMPCFTALNHYYQYLKDNNLPLPAPKNIQDKVDELIGYIVDDKMTLKAASKKANMSYESGKKYYLKYRKDHNIDVPTPKVVTQDQINQLIGYVVDDKMTVKAASKKANMSATYGHKHYHRYLNNQKRDIPVRHPQVISAPENE